MPRLSLGRDVNVSLIEAHGHGLANGPVGEGSAPILRFIQFMEPKMLEGGCEVTRC